MFESTIVGLLMKSRSFEEDVKVGRYVQEENNELLDLWRKRISSFSGSFVEMASL